MNDPLSVIVVDDQAPFRLAARAVLRRTEGFELVGEAANGLEAISLADALHPDLVLMDINMPEMGGLEATRRIVAGHPAHCRVPVLDLRRERPARRRQDQRRPGLHAQRAARLEDPSSALG